MSDDELVPLEQLAVLTKTPVSAANLEPGEVLAEQERASKNELEGRLQDLESFVAEVREVVDQRDPQFDPIRRALVSLDDYIEKGEGMDGEMQLPPGHPFRTIDAAYANRGPERTLPHNRDAEIALLGAILRNNAVLGKSALAGMKEKEFFFRDAHRRIFKAMRALYERGVPIDFATLAVELERLGELDEVGGRFYLRALLDYPQADAVATYVEIIRDKARIRTLIFALNRSLAECYEAELSAGQLIGEVMRRVWEIAEGILYPDHKDAVQTRLEDS